MKISKVAIKNFRRLKDISFEIKDSINTIVGPNGIGKSSVLDAIRLTKAILLSNSENEAQQTLQHMGLYSPHLGNVLFENICGDINQDTIIDLKFTISDQDIRRIESDLANFNILRLQNQLGQNASSQLSLVGLLSNPAGQQKLKEIGEDTDKLIIELKKTNVAHIRLTIGLNKVVGHNGFHQEIVSYLFKNENFSETQFTVFPADRNFPTGDTNIQLGQNEINQQVQSYSIQPQLKFNRLKAAIISYIMLNNNDITPIQTDFKLIFDSLLPGKELTGINIEKRTGRLSVIIKETDSGAEYDIDFLSSGEKGLLLTLFLLIRTVSTNGIILLDEPELHLNPAVCQNIIPFLKEHICKKKNAQIILTSHSAEILANTKDDNDFCLLHLIDSNTISPIYKKDNEEAQEAIKCLGIRTSDLLFNRGIIYLEGTTDDDYINEVLKGVVSGYKIQSLGGRTIVENEIKALQEADKKDELKGYHIFILDFDNKPTTLKDSRNVKVIQWDRYSFENYLLNLNILYDIVNNNNSKDFPNNRGEFNKQAKELAYSQIDQISLYKVLENKSPSIISVSKKEIKGKDFDEISKIASSKISQLKSELNSYESNDWETSFTSEIQKTIEETKVDWEEHWKTKCKGKELLIAIHNKYKIKNYKEFISQLIRANKEEDSEEWKILKSKMSPITDKKK